MLADGTLKSEGEVKEYKDIAMQNTFKVIAENASTSIP